MCGILAILDTRTRPGTDQSAPRVQIGNLQHHLRARPVLQLRGTRPGEAAGARSFAEHADALLERLAHRGPDGRGTLALSNAWLGHRRLAIVDPAGGQQPFRRGDVAWVANGEIFNHAALRRRLDMQGLSASDCAVIGPLWQKHGPQAPAMLDGEYAFVAVNERDGTWIAARDHVGVCPLYVGWHADGTVWFASEIKALVDHCAAVELVPPGHAWLQDAHGLRCVRWYDPSWQHAVPSERVDLARLRHTLIDAVVERLMTDVPWGLLLSGGLDSSLIAAIATRCAGQARNCRALARRFHTFSIGLPGAPDLRAARRVAEFLGTHHHEFTFTVDEALAAVPAVVRHLETYQQIRTGVPTYLLAQRIRRLGIKMVLSGEGADEVFGGYLYFHKAPDEAEFHRETVRKVTRLHQFDVLRANKAPMAWGLEVRVPYLDREFLDLTMSIAPREKRIAMDLRPDGVHPRMEKYILRKAFDDARRPWLPADILWRQKEQFSDGVGYDWVDHLRAFAAERLSPADWAGRGTRYPEDTPSTPELYWMRELFEAAFVEGKAAGRSPVATVGHGRSVACSTPEALAWDPAWNECSGDISGRAIAGVHAAADEFQLETPPKRTDEAA